MNVLLITPSLPSEFNRIRSLNILKALSRRHQIFLVSLSPVKNPDLESIGKYCQEIKIVYKPRYRSWLDSLIGLVGREPLEISYVQSHQLKRLMSDMIQKNRIDLIYVKRLRSAQFVPANTKIPVILDTTDAMSLFYERATKNVPWFKKPLYWEEYFKYNRYEYKIAQEIKHWVVCSKPDLDHLKSKLPTDVRLYYVPNVVDINYYQLSTVAPEPHSLIFSGLMDKFVNIEAAKFLVTKIWPLILEQYPTAKLYIVGPNPTTNIKRFAGDNVIVTGQVSDLRECAVKAGVVACPILTGTGTRNKILQAWAIGRPVVSTTLGLEGLEAKHAEQILIADRPEDFADNIIKLWQNENLYNKLVNGGRKLVEEKYSLGALEQHLDQVFKQVVPNYA